MNDIDETHEFPCGEPVDAFVRIGGGDLTVMAEPTQSVRVSVTPYDDSEASRDAATHTRVDFSAGRLRVEVPDSGSGWIFKRSGRVHIDIHLPEQSRLRAQSGSADVRVDGAVGSLDVSTGSGDTTIVSTSGDVVVKTGSGDVRAHHIGGELRATSGSGDVSAHLVAGGITAMTASGDVDIDDAQGTIRTNTASGDIRLRAVHSGDVKANSASGDVTVGVPTGTRVWLDLNTVSGSTTSNLDVSSAPPAGGTQVSLKLTTVSGDITINRVSAAPPPPPVPPVPPQPPAPPTLAQPSTVDESN